MVAKLLATCLKIPNIADIPSTEEDFKAVLNGVLANSGPTELQSVLNTFVDALGSITLIIDEANISLTINDKTPIEKIESTKQALALFTTLTKEEKKVSVSSL
jgi:hypothetical protein